MSKGKSDAPPFWGRVVRTKSGKHAIVPMAELDERKLASYGDGAELRIKLWQGRSQPLLRKYWAALGAAVDNCPTPWESKDEANRALKVACGVVEIDTAANGEDMIVSPGSIAFEEMEEADFRSYFDQAMDVLAEVTGVPAEELLKQGPDTGEENSADAEGEPIPLSTTPSADEGDAAATTATEGAASPPSPPDGSRDEDPRWIYCVRQFLAIPSKYTGKEASDKSAEMWGWWANNLPVEMHGRLENLKLSTDAVIAGQAGRDRLIEMYQKEFEGESLEPSEEDILAIS